MEPTVRHRLVHVYHQDACAALHHDLLIFHCQRAYIILSLRIRGAYRYRGSTHISDGGGVLGPGSAGCACSNCLASASDRPYKAADDSRGLVQGRSFLSCCHFGIPHALCLGACIRVSGSLRQLPVVRNHGTSERCSVVDACQRVMLFLQPVCMPVCARQIFHPAFARPCQRHEEGIRRDHRYGARSDACDSTAFVWSNSLHFWRAHIPASSQMFH
mmetsp:Transcript_28190/g.86147  ORF Transcript_28190/g.86147 Transcript_28190/m.86147 type:complete len:216 (+) Transcript_28190:313-960(+)